jgi:hypothetical protein
VKGEVDSGSAAPLMAGVIELFEKHKDKIAHVSAIYGSRMSSLIYDMEKAGMLLAAVPQAGFFTLWQCPKRAFGENIGSAEQFNNLMFERTGILGVPFEPYIRYAVCATDVQSLADHINKGLNAAQIKY